MVNVILIGLNWTTDVVLNVHDHENPGLFKDNLSIEPNNDCDFFKATRYPCEDCKPPENTTSTVATHYRTVCSICPLSWGLNYNTISSPNNMTFGHAYVTLFLLHKISWLYYTCKNKGHFVIYKSRTSTLYSIKGKLLPSKLLIVGFNSGMRIPKRQHNIKKGYPQNNYHLYNYVHCMSWVRERFLMVFCQFLSHSASNQMNARKTGLYFLPAFIKFP